MILYKTARYRVNPEKTAEVEETMQAHAQRLKEQFPGFIWRGERGARYDQHPK